MENLSGGTLTSLMKRMQSSMPINSAIRMGKSISSAMRFLHHDAIPGYTVIHRDLKPDNVGFTFTGELRLFDFGLAKVIKRKYQTTNDAYKMTSETGSPRYMAPEVALGHEYNEKVDVYSWAVILWQMASSKVPFTEYTDISEFAREVLKGGKRPPLVKAWETELRDLISDSWQADYKQRPSFVVIDEAMEALGVLYPPVIAGACNCEIS